MLLEKYLSHQDETRPNVNPKDLKCCLNTAIEFTVSVAIAKLEFGRSLHRRRCLQSRDARSTKDERDTVDKSEEISHIKGFKTKKACIRSKYKGYFVMF